MNSFERFIDKLYRAMNTGRASGVDEITYTTDYELRLEPSIRYYSDFLFEKTSRIFEWSGLPFDQKILEVPVLATGYSGFTFDSEYNNFVALPGGLTGVTPFGDLQPLQFVYAAPGCAGGTKYIFPYINNGDAVIISNTNLRTPIMPLVDRYAVLLAHADVSIRDALINIRYNDVIPAATQEEAEAVKNWHDDIIRGVYSPVPDSTLLNRPPIVPLNATGKGQIALDTIEARADLLRSFLAEIGLRMTKDKRSNMISDEVTSSDMVLMFNISDMLKQRQAAAENINKCFGLNTSVKLSPEFETLKEGETEYDGDN